MDGVEGDFAEVWEGGEEVHASFFGAREIEGERLKRLKGREGVEGDSREDLEVLKVQGLQLAWEDEVQGFRLIRFDVQLQFLERRDSIEGDEVLGDLSFEGEGAEFREEVKIFEEIRAALFVDDELQVAQAGHRFEEFEALQVQFFEANGEVREVGHGGDPLKEGVVVVAWEDAGEGLKPEGDVGALFKNIQFVEPEDGEADDDGRVVIDLLGRDPFFLVALFGPGAAGDVGAKLVESGFLECLEVLSDGSGDGIVLVKDLALVKRSYSVFEASLTMVRLRERAEDGFILGVLKDPAL